MVGCQMYYKPIKFDQNCWCHFWENRNCYFPFLMWTTVNFRGSVKIKNKRPWILQTTADIEFQRYRSIGLGAMFSDCHRDRRTDKWTFFFFCKTLFLKCVIDIEWNSINNRSRIFFYDCNTFFAPDHRLYKTSLEIKIKMLKSNFRTFASILKIPPRR